MHRSIQKAGRSALIATTLLLGTLAAGQERDEQRRGPDNRAAAFDALFQQWDQHGIPGTGGGVDRQLRRLQALVPPGDDRRQTQYRYLSCVHLPGDAERALTTAAGYLAEAQRRGDLEAQLRFQLCRGRFLEIARPMQEALVAYTAGVELARRTGDRRQEGNALVFRGNVHSVLGQHALSLQDFLAGQATFQAAGLPDMVERNLQNIGLVYRRMGEFEQAEIYLRKSRAHSMRTDNWIALATDLAQLGFLYDETGRYDEGIAVFEEMISRADEQIDPFNGAFARLGLAGVLIRKAEHRRALEMLDAAQRKFDKFGHSADVGMMELRRGEARAGLGEHARALVHYNRSAAAWASSDNLRYRSMLAISRSRSHEALGNLHLALADLKQYVELREKLRRDLGDQRTLLLRHQFDADRRELENRRLVAERALNDQQLGNLQRTQRWQRAAIGLGVLLVLLLAGLAVRQLLRLRRLGTIAATDALTGIANRRAIEYAGHAAVRHAQQTQQQLATLVFDIDHFKRVNDSLGHPAGDIVLVRVAQACLSALRAGDLLGRTGGEEFLVLLPKARPEQAAMVAERLRSCVETLDLSDVSPELQVTISLGTSQYRDGDRLQDLAQRADEALYRAKAAGRNRFEAEL